jgi:hypothetical protein
MAAQAWTEAGSFGIGRNAVKSNLLAPWLP